ncbi:unnamed protein product [Pleuronectes platessa]|uniref:Uncharacterized protein n=1 Tax=Pleuronectes platessa TaxID=8262 RepID=A0A9N7Y924_PLEPL|nr:unnamed protein product [Pleuronectes platessa]
MAMTSPSDLKFALQTKRTQHRYSPLENGHCDRAKWFYTAETEKGRREGKQMGADDRLQIMKGVGVLHPVEVEVPAPHIIFHSLLPVSLFSLVPLMACSFALPVFLSWLPLPWQSDNCWSLHC